MREEAAIHLARADAFLNDSRILLEAGSFSSSISRSYYAIFHAVKAILSEFGIERKSHQAVWSEFGQKVAKPGLMDKKYHSMGVKLFHRRLESDYLPQPNETVADAQQAISFATEFVAACRAFLESRDKR